MVSPLDQTKVFAPVPPETVKLTDPVEFPKHGILVVEIPAVSAVGFETVTFAMAVQPFTSETVTE